LVVLFFEERLIRYHDGAFEQLYALFLRNPAQVVHFNANAM